MILSMISSLTKSRPPVCFQKYSRFDKRFRERFFNGKDYARIFIIVRYSFQLEMFCCGIEIIITCRRRKKQNVYTCFFEAWAKKKKKKEGKYKYLYKVT